MSCFLLFDAYGTLVELDDFYGRLQRGFAARGAKMPAGAVKAAAQREMHYYIQHSVRARDHASWLALRRECAAILAEGLRDQGWDSGLADELILEVLAEAIVFRTYPDTEAALAHLHDRGVPMGVLSNWDYQLGDILDAMGLACYFAFILSSSQIGVEKPSPLAFARGLQLAQAVHPELQAADCYYVGDHYEKDMVPARAAGMTPVWLVRASRDLASGDTHEGDSAVIRIASLSELEPLIPM